MARPSACRDDARQVVDIDAADRERRQRGFGQRLAHIAQTGKPREALRLRWKGLGRRRDIAGAIQDRLPQLGQVMGADTDQRVASHDAVRVLHGQLVLAEMHPVGLGEACDIGLSFTIKSTPSCVSRPPHLAGALEQTP